MILTCKYIGDTIRYMNKFYFDKKFYLDKKTGYWISSACPKIRAHVWVWNNIHGKVPKGYHIHHKDEDKSNNQIDNLELIERSRHMSIHMQDPIKRQRAKEMADKYRHLTKAWHASPEGLAWHKLHGIKGWKNRKELEITCKICNEKCLTKSYNQEFCSNKCKSQWRRDSGIDNIEKKCVICDKTFNINKYSKQKCCDLSCAAKYRWRNIK